MSSRLGRVCTREVMERRQAEAIRFARHMVHDLDLAEELEGLTVEEYAKRRGVRIIDRRRRSGLPNSRTELSQENRDLRIQVAELADTLDEIADLIGGGKGWENDDSA